MEGMVTCFNSSNNKIIGVQHCIQDRSRQINQIELLNGDPRASLVGGASKTYESFGAGQIAQCLQMLKVKVMEVVKDGDSNCLTAIQKYYPDILEILDTNHYIKNIPG